MVLTIPNLIKPASVDTDAAPPPQMLVKQAFASAARVRRNR